MQNKKTRGGGSRGTRRISPTTVVEKLGNTCLLEQEENDNNVTKFVSEVEKIYVPCIVNAMIICPTWKGTRRSSFSHQRAPSSTFLYETPRILIWGQRYQYYLSSIFHLTVELCSSKWMTLSLKDLKYRVK